MAPTDSTLRRDVARILAWTAVLPALAAWPVLSAFPALALLAEPASLWEAAIQVLLLVTGFWAVSPLAIGYWMLLSDKQRIRQSAIRKQYGLLIGAYATLWTALYVLAAFVFR